MLEPLSEARKARLEIEPLENHIHEMSHQDDILKICSRNLGTMDAQLKLAEAVRRYKESKGQAGVKVNSEEEQRLLRVSQHEVENGFPLLGSWAVVSLTSSLDSVIPAFLSNWLLLVPESRLIAQVANVKVRIIDYSTMTEEERYDYIIDILIQEYKTPLKDNINRYEDVLNIFGLSGPVDDNLRKAIFEMHQIRNAVVHRRSNADRRLVERCPWLELKVGDRLVVTLADYWRYKAAVSMYLTEIIYRAAVKRELTLPPRSEVGTAFLLQRGSSTRYQTQYDISPTESTASE